MATRASRVALESAVRRIVGAAYDTLLDADALDAVDDVFLDDLLRKVRAMELFLEKAKTRRLRQQTADGALEEVLKREPRAFDWSRCELRHTRHKANVRASLILDADGAPALFGAGDAGDVVAMAEETSGGIEDDEPPADFDLRARFATLRRIRS